VTHRTTFLRQATSEARTRLTPSPCASARTHLVLLPHALSPRLLLRDAGAVSQGLGTDAPILCVGSRYVTQPSHPSIHPAGRSPRAAAHAPSLYAATTSARGSTLSARTCGRPRRTPRPTPPSVPLAAFQIETFHAPSRTAPRPQKE
jgi:hypothetical protein